MPPRITQWGRAMGVTGMDEAARNVTAQEAFAQHAATLYRYIYSRVGHAALAEDLTSQVFLKALRWIDAGRSGESVRGWLYAAARTSIAEYWRSQSTLTLVPLDRADQECATHPEERDEEAVRRARQQVRRLLERLPERDRRVLALRYLRGLNAAEVGQMLGLSAEYVRVVQFRALRHAAQIAREEGKTAVGSNDATVGSEGMERALRAAEEEARGLNHHYIGTEHLLLGLFREPESAAVRLLTAMRASEERIRGGLLLMFGRGDKPPAAGELAPTARAKRALDLAEEEARRAGSATIASDHVLLGLLREGDGIAAVILDSLDVRLETVRATLEPGTDPFVAWACAFCGKGRESVRRLIQGPGWVTRAATGPAKQPLLICDECVARCTAIIAEAEAKEVEVVGDRARVAHYLD